MAERAALVFAVSALVARWDTATLTRPLPCRYRDVYGTHGRGECRGDALPNRIQCGFSGMTGGTAASLLDTVPHSRRSNPGRADVRIPQVRAAVLSERRVCAGGVHVAAASDGLRRPRLRLRRRRFQLECVHPTRSLAAARGRHHARCVLLSTSNAPRPTSQSSHRAGAWRMEFTRDPTVILVYPGAGNVSLARCRNAPGAR